MFAEVEAAEEMQQSSKLQLMKRQSCMSNWNQQSKFSKQQLKEEHFGKRQQKLLLKIFQQLSNIIAVALVDYKGRTDKQMKMEQMLVDTQQLRELQVRKIIRRYRAQLLYQYYYSTPLRSYDDMWLV